MTLFQAIKDHEGFSRRISARCAAGIRGLIGAPRRILIESSDFVLGAEAIPAPIAVRAPVIRR